MAVAAPSLRRSLVRGSAWTLGGIAAIQIIRFGRSLILSRLLYPEAYGVVAIVWALLTSLNLLSDVGLSPGIVRSARADAAFLNTAWTMKVVRGGVLCVLCVALAYPASLVYRNASLTPLIAAAGLASLIEGFGSTNLYSCQREMQYGRISLLDLASQFFGPLVTIGWAYYYPSPWALVGGALFGQLFQMAGSHLMLPGIRNHFAWDARAFRELAHFGKWVLFSSAIFLFYSQGDRLLLGHYLDAKLLGIYSIALLLSDSLASTINKLTDSVFFSALSRTVNEDRARLRQVLYRTKLGMDVLLIVPISALMVLGTQVVAFLYDPRYHEAGWMLQLMCIRLVMLTMLVGGASSLFALGMSRYQVAQNVGRAAWILIGIPVGWHVWGIIGVVWAIALTELPGFFVVWPAMRKYQLLSVSRELRSLFFVAVGLSLGLGLSHLAMLVLQR